MERRALGRSGLVVSALGFGCGSVGGLLVRGEPTEQRAAVAAALEAGVTYFDTAPTYGDGRSEAALGRTLRELRTDALVGTKFRLRADETDVAAAIRRSLEASLTRLGRERVDLLQLHSRVGAAVNENTLPVETVLGPVADGLDALKAEGRVRAIGLTGLGDPASLHRVMESARFDTVQAYVNVINPSAAYAGTAPAGQPDFGGLIGRASANGMGVLAIRTLAAGAVAGGARHPAAGAVGAGLIPGASYADDARRASDLEQLAAEVGLEGRVELAFRFAVGIAGVSTVLVGFSDAAQVREATRFAARGPLPEAALARLRERFEAGKPA